MAWSESFVEYAAGKLAEYMAQLRRCAALLSDEQAWRRPNEHSNSIGNLLLHLRGNVSQWILGGLGGQTIQRDRGAEFAERRMLPIRDVVTALDAVIAQAVATIRSLDAARLAAPASIQGYSVTGLSAVFHVVEHFAFHTGQVVWWTKALLDVDLSLYDVHGHRIDGRNTGAP